MKERVIYVGPNLAAQGLQRFTVFTAIPRHVAGDATLARLFVPVASLARVRKAQKIQGTPEWCAVDAARNPRARKAEQQPQSKKPEPDPEPEQKSTGRVFSVGLSEETRATEK